MAAFTGMRPGDYSAAAPAGILVSRSLPIRFRLPMEGPVAASSYRLSFRCARIEIALFGVLVALCVVCCGAARAEKFRIETKIFVGKEDSKAKPVSEATTLFLDGTVYDFLTEPPQVAVFRKPGGGNPGRFILLDEQHRIRTELTTEQLARAMSKLRSWAGQQDDPLLQFAARPQFKESFAEENGKLVLASHIENYTVATTPATKPTALAEYREFLDWYAQLNTLLGAGPPPEPRLRLNEALARHQVLPLEVELTRQGEKDCLRAEHKFTWRLSHEDQAKIDVVRESLASYRDVENQEFLRLTQPDEPAE
jgi:hypothetical protein